MKYLITGGAGFIGSHFAEFLLAQGHEVFALDNLNTGSMKNIEHLLQNPKYHFVQGSILDYNTLLDLVGTCDRIAHFAAAVGVKYIIDNPLESLQINTRGTENVLELCSKFQKKVLIASTSEVYGKNENIPLREDYDRVLGSTHIHRWSYACSKAFDEFLGLAYVKTKKLPVVIVRFFNTVGPRQTGRYGMVIPRLTTQALENQPITVYGDGQQTRTFGFVKDVIKAVGTLFDCEAAEGQIYNIGGQEEVKIIDLAKRIKEKTRSSSEIKLVPYDQAYEKDFEDMRRRVPDCTKLEKAIGFRPTTGLDQILDEVIRYYQKG